MAEPSLFTPGALNADYGALNLIALGAQYNDISGAMTEGETRIGRSSTGIGAYYLPPGSWTLPRNHTIPENVKLYLEYGATLNVAAGKTLNVLGGYAGPGKFGTTGTIVFDNIEEIDVRDFGVKTNDSNDYSSNMNAVIAAANGVSSGSAPAVGAVVSIPVAQINVAATLTTPGYNVTLSGVDVQGGNGRYPASILVQTDTTLPLFDLGSSATNHNRFRNLGLIGSGGTNLAHRAIVSAHANDLDVIDCFINNWGGQGVLLSAGADIHFYRTTFTNCLLKYLSSDSGLAAYVGSLQLGTIENVVEGCNINGISGLAAGSAGTGFMTAAYFTNAECHLRYNTFAFSQIGVRMDTSQFNDLIGNRFEYNQRQGMYADCIDSRFIGNRFQDNSMSADATYNHCTIGSAGVNGYRNVLVGNIVTQIDQYTTNKALYGFDLQGGGGTTYNLRVEAWGNAGTGYTTALYAPAGGSAPLSISPMNMIQAVSVANGGATDAGGNSLSAQKGNIFSITASNNSGASAIAINAPANPIKGQIITLMITNSSGGALTATFSSTWKTSSYTDPANGKYKLAQFNYDGAHWNQIGSWSGDMS